MTDTQHTPGPWRAEWVPKGQRPWVGRIAEGRWAALACGKTDEEAEANARLIAAAPELLAALQAVADYWAGGDVPADIDAAMRAAIAKATGQ